MNTRTNVSGPVTAPRVATPPLPPAQDAASSGRRRTGLVLALVAAWLAMSTLFLIPVINDPDLAIRGDDYWAFSLWFGSSEPYPNTHFGPLFPLLLRGLRELGFTVAGAVFVQKLMVLLSGYLIYRIARDSGVKPVIAILAGGLYTLYPITQAQSSLMFAETFYLTLVLASVAILLPALAASDRARTGSLVAGFVLLGLACLARGNGLVLYAGLGVVALVRCPWRKVLLAGVLGALPVLFWSGLNYHWYGHFKPTSSGDANIAASIVGPVYSELEGKPRIAGPDVWIEGKGHWQELYPNPFDYAIAVRAMAIDYALDHPGAVVVGNVKGWFRSLLGPARQDYLALFGPPGDVLSIISGVVRAVLLAGLVLFIVTGAWRRAPLFATVLLLMLLGHIASSGAAGFARFGFPVDAFTTIALALALTLLVDRRLGRRAGRPAPMSAPQARSPSAPSLDRSRG